MRKKSATTLAAIACAIGMLLSGCGSAEPSASNENAGGNVITAFNTEPQNTLIPGNTNETSGAMVIQLLFANLVAFDNKGDAKM